jgi:hypothetical protein
VLRAEGYTLLDDRLDRRGRPDLHHRLEHPGRPAIDLHWRLHWHEEAFARDLLGRARATGTIAAADEAAALLLFYARDGFYGLRLAADIGLVGRSRVFSVRRRHTCNTTIIYIRAAVRLSPVVYLFFCLLLLPLYVYLSQFFQTLSYFSFPITLSTILYILYFLFSAILYISLDH